MLRRGFSFANVIILSGFITLLGIAGLIIANLNAATSRAEDAYLWAEKAANAGMLEAMQRIKATGFCDVSETFNGKIGDVNAEYEVNIKRSGRICFIRSEGSFRNARVVKAGILQAYYGVGLYTVRGNVNAQLGSGVRLSGCDNTVKPVCYVPAFIASGTVSSAIPPKACTQDSGGIGVYGGTTGAEAIITYFKYKDLIPLFFNANCFNNKKDSKCDEGLLQIFEREYGKNPLSGRQDLYFDNQWGIPRVDFSGLPPNGACVTMGYWDGSKYVIDVSSPNLAGCTDVSIDIPSGANVEITGIVNRYLNIYALDRDINSVSIVSQISSQGFTLYSNKQVSIQSNLKNARIVIDNRNLTVAANTTIQGSTIILGFSDISATNNVTGANGNIHTRGNITLDKSYVFARRIRFNDYSTVNIYDSLIYVYAYACPNCSRTGTSSLSACGNNEAACGWYGNGNRFYLGYDINTRQYRPSLVISNNTTVRFISPSDTIYIIGAFVGDDITYLSYYNASQRFLGFLVRNFPPNETLGINISSNFAMEFNKTVLDKLSDNFWYFRRVDCIRDDISPRTQLIHTRLIAY